MSEPADILHRIQDGVAQNPDPLPIIEQLAARTPADAIQWARRLPLWDDFRGQYPGQRRRRGPAHFPAGDEGIQARFRCRGTRRRGEADPAESLSPGRRHSPCRSATRRWKVATPTIICRASGAGYFPSSARSSRATITRWPPTSPMRPERRCRLAVRTLRPATRSEHAAARSDLPLVCGGEAPGRGRADGCDAEWSAAGGKDAPLKQRCQQAGEERAVVGQHTAEVVQAEPSGRTRHVSLFD